AASQTGVVATESIASFYAPNMAAGNMSADTTPLPMSLEGISVQVRDSAGATRPAPLYFVSPTQVNFQIPPGTATGQATFTLMNGAAPVGSPTTAVVGSIAPAIFTADSSGKGVAAAQSVQQGVGGLQAINLIFQCANNACTSVPINLGVDTPTSLVLYGTGIRNRSALSGVTATIKGVNAPVFFAGAQGVFVGLDQVNLSLPLNLRGSGESDLILTVDGQTANTVRVNIQ